MIDTLLNRLRDQCPGLTAVELPTRANPVQRADYPVATLYLTDETPTDKVGGRPQVARRYSLVYTATSFAQLDTVRAQANAALYRWKPTGTGEPCAFAGGRLVSEDGPFIQWVDTWTFSTFLTGV